MKEEKILKNELEKLIKKGVLVVGVYQNTDNNYNKINKMILKNIWKDAKSNTMQLLGFLYRKTILKSNIRIDYSYNYSDSQTITFTENYINYDNTITKTKYVFYNIPTNMAFLDTYKLENQIK